MADRRLNVAQRIWGPATWTMLHSMAYGAPEVPSKKERHAIEETVNSFALLMPCKACRTHFADMLHEFPIEKASHSRDAFIQWTIDRHNDVNARLGKPQMARREVDARFTAKSAQCSVRSFLASSSVQDTRPDKAVHGSTEMPSQLDQCAHDSDPVEEKDRSCVHSTVDDDEQTETTSAADEPSPPRENTEGKRSSSRCPKYHRCPSATTRWSHIAFAILGTLFAVAIFELLYFRVVSAGRSRRATTE